MSTLAIIAGFIWTPGLVLGGSGWCASRVSPTARRWIGRQLFG